MKGQFAVCNGIDLLAGKLFFNPPLEVASGDANAWSAMVTDKPGSHAVARRELLTDAASGIDRHTPSM